MSNCREISKRDIDARPRNSMPEDIIVTAQRLIRSEMNLIEGVREICATASRHGVSDLPEIILLRGIESETDDFPLGQMREHCAAGYLDRMDKEMSVYLENMGEEILAACAELVSKYPVRY